MKKLITLVFLFTLSAGFSQSNEELIKTVIEFKDVKEFLSKNVVGEIYLKKANGFISLRDGEQLSILEPNHLALTLESVIEEGDKYKLKFNIDDHVFGKVTVLATQNELNVRRAFLKAGDGKNKSKMVSLEF